MTIGKLLEAVTQDNLHMGDLLPGITYTLTEGHPEGKNNKKEMPPWWQEFQALGHQGREAI